MNAEFNVWLLIVGLIVGAGLVWLVLMDSRRHEAEIDADERPREAAWLSAVMSEDGFAVSPEAAERLLILHRAYLGAAPPDEVEDEDDQLVEGPELELSEEPNWLRLETADEDRSRPDRRPSGIDQ